MNTNEENQKVDLKAFANMAGFPIDLVKKELFSHSKFENDAGLEEVSIEELRAAMISYLDSAMMEKS